MKEHPILFSGPMVRAILEDRKTQTRRVVKEPIYINLAESVRGDWPIGHQCVALPGRYVAHLNFHGAISVKTPYGLLGVKPAEFTWECPYSHTSDRLWVRETFAIVNGKTLYCADHNSTPLRWQPSVFMPRWASRLLLEITGIRVERLQQITCGGCIEKSDIQEEGCPFPNDPEKFGMDEAEWFVQTWDALNAKRGFGWSVNPWVWVVTFKRI